MGRQTYLDLAAAGARMPIGTHLVLHAQPQPEAILLDGRRLGAVITETADRFHTTLAVPFMDLTLEKAALLAACGAAAAEIDTFHFIAPPAVPAESPLTPRMQANCEALVHLTGRPDLVPIGMAIGPFSLMTKLVTDPITPVYLAGSGITANEDGEVALIEQLLAVGERVIHRYLKAQMDAGARAIIICEPAANQVYFSPNQLARNPAIFDRYVIEPMRRIAQLLSARGVDLIFHDCGELTDGMVRSFSMLGAVMLSFGSSRKLWKDALLVPRDTVLYGNLPTKRFCATQLTVAEVKRLAHELVTRMAAVGHPFILGSECDVLSVPGKEEEILRKVDAFMSCAVPDPVSEFVTSRAGLITLQEEVAPKRKKHHEQ
jgi:uroporphyrinogen-III decarboxylase